MPYWMRHRSIIPDGSLKYLHTLGRPLLDQFGAITEYVGTVVDITDRKRAEEELRKSTYGVYREAEGGTERALFVSDGEGQIHWSHISPIGVNPGANGILSALEELQNEGE